MAKYIKQELPDLHKKGEKKAYYRLQTERNIDFQGFVEQICSHHSSISRGVAILVLMLATDALAELLAQGYSVTIDDLGTFRATVGLTEDKEMDSIDGKESKRNARSLCLNGVHFLADKELIQNTNRRCKLERAGISRLHRSPFTKEERLQKALEYLETNGAMKVKQYMTLTGLSHTVAAHELREFEHDVASGIDSIGRLAGKVYVKRPMKADVKSET